MDPTAMPNRPELKSTPSSDGGSDHASVSTGAAKAMASTSKPSMAFRTMQMPTAVT